MKCRRCGELEDKEMIVIRGSVHTALYCKKCNSWLKWLKKQDVKTIKIIGNIEVK